MSGATLDFRSYSVDGPDFGKVIDHLKHGGLLVYPTETVYGLGGMVGDSVLGTLVAAKNRGPDEPFLLLIPSRESVDHLAWTPAAVDLADVFWPGSVTIVLRDEIGRFPLGVRSPEGTVAVRMSPHPLIADLVNTLHAPLISTSVNAPGEPPALSASEAVDAVESLGLGEDLLILDGGRLDPSPASTIIDCSGDRPVMLREGTVPLERVRCVLPGVEADSDG